MKRAPIDGWVIVAFVISACALAEISFYAGEIVTAHFLCAP